MTECGSCLKSIRSEDIKLILLCNGPCGKVFHIQCTDLNDTGKTRQNLSQKKSTWRCSDCRSQSDQKLLPDGCDEMNIMEMLSGIDRKVSKIDNIESTLNHNEVKMRENVEKIDTMTKLLNEVMEGQKEIKLLKEDNKKLHNKLGILEEKVTNLEQRSGLCNIEVSGVPITKNESTEIIKKIGQVIGIQIQPQDIIMSHRVPTKAGQIPNIICQLRDRKIKGQWMQVYKNYLKRNKNTGLQALQLNNGWANSRIYINTHLTMENKQKLYETKTRARQLGFNFIWVNNDGQILVRKSENTPILTIRSSKDIARLNAEGSFAT